LNANITAQQAAFSNERTQLQAQISQKADAMAQQSRIPPGGKQWTVKQNAVESSSVNFLNVNNEILFHFNPRPDEQ
jgi:hypothetical protein